MFKDKFNFKSKEIKNKLLLKRGGYSLAVTALFLVAVIVINILIGALNDRFNLEIDLSAEKESSFTAENIEYLKKLDKDINIIVCASEENYVGYTVNYVQSSFGVMGDYSAYYKQTIKLITKYADYSDKIKIDFVDMYNDPAFDAINQKYSKENLSYGSIIVTAPLDATSSATERYKVLQYDDIYELIEDSNNYYAQMGYSSYTIGSNKVESAVSGAIAYVLGSDTKKVAFLTGHSPSDMSIYVDAYEKLLLDNNFEVEKVSKLPINEISADTDVIVILAPVTDLLDEEVSTISAFLENDGNYGKGLIYFGSSACPLLPNLTDLLAEWNIKLLDGKLFDTSGQFSAADDPYTLYSYDNYYSPSYQFVTSSNQPMELIESDDTSMEAVSINTAEYMTIAPASASADWSGYNKDDAEDFPVIAQSTKTTYDSESQEIYSSVTIFSSLDFIASGYTEESNVSNKDMTLGLTQAAVQAENTGINFVPKTITSESFASQVTESSSNTVKVIFMFMLPVLMLGLAVYIFIRRKNA